MAAGSRYEAPELLRLLLLMLLLASWNNICHTVTSSVSPIRAPNSERRSNMTGKHTRRAALRKRVALSAVAQFSHSAIG